MEEDMESRNEELCLENSQDVSLDKPDKTVVENELNKDADDKKQRQKEFNQYIDEKDSTTENRKSFFVLGIISLILSIAMLAIIFVFMQQIIGLIQGASGGVGANPQEGFAKLISYIILIPLSLVGTAMFYVPATVLNVFCFVMLGFSRKSNIKGIKHASNVFVFLNFLVLIGNIASIILAISSI
ncbi:MAG: hypothetical protein RR400_03970 [Clostridia bacterium]